MNSGKLKESLALLGIDSQDLAHFLDVNLRTIKRWMADEISIPTGVIRLFEAWIMLHKIGLPWRPDGEKFITPNALKQQIALHNQAVLELTEIIKKVNKRGGPAAPWVVNLGMKRATLEKMWISFYTLPNGGFTPQSYGRSDRNPDFERDRPLLEDGFVCIAEAIAKERKKLKEAKWDLIEI